MSNLKKPANVSFVSNLLIQLINAEVISSDWTTALVFNFEPDIEFVETAMDQELELSLKLSIYELGFETYNPILNLGGLYIFLVYIALKVLFFIVIFLYGKWNKKYKISFEEEGGDAETWALNTQDRRIEEQTKDLAVVVNE